MEDITEYPSKDLPYGWFQNCDVWLEPPSTSQSDLLVIIEMVKQRASVNPICTTKFLTCTWVKGSNRKSLTCHWSLIFIRGAKIMTSFKDNLQINSMTFTFSLLYLRLDIFLKVKPWEFIGRLFHKSRKFNFPSLISPSDAQILAKL